eukprot:4173980-Ditylum_brightwellii.AAC.1
MKYHEGQVEYYRKKGMSVLGAMEYKFVNCIFKGYAGQDNVQVALALEIMVQDTKRKHPGIKEIVLQSNNATCFASQDHIPFLFHTNAESHNNGNPIVTKWIYTKTQTGRGHLATHFSYLNLILKSFVEDGNGVMLEEDILEALKF